jgi:hypothetical protein
MASTRFVAQIGGGDFPFTAACEKVSRKESAVFVTFRAPRLVAYTRNVGQLAGDVEDGVRISGIFF